ncbi:hypothetical protein B0H21DRAFT_159204 [Amylocystis lapponica]|nr:hypothetical protein B0H21DRAFT_159204 [Amylocystis lapponica]
MFTAGQAAKDKGNAAFKAGDFPAAIGHYSSAVTADPKNPTYPLNRAAAYLKLGKHEDAERDCSTVLTLDARNVKALFRRAQARVALQRLQDAQADLKQALVLDPPNEPAKQELKRVEESLEQQRKPRQKKQPIDVSHAPAVSASPVHPKRRRIPIEIVEAPVATSEPTAVPGNATPDDLMTPVSSRPLASTSLAGSTPTAASTVPQKTQPPATFQQAKIAREGARQRPGGGIFRADGKHTLFGAKEADKGRGTQTDEPGANASPPQELSSSPRPEAVPAPPVKPAVATVPNGASKTQTLMTLFAFTRRWERLKTAEERWALIDEIPPQALPSLFQSSLEASMLTSLLDAFRSVLQAPSEDALATQERVRMYMQHLVRVRRFGTIVLLMSAEERALVRAVWELADTEGAEAGARRAWGIS